MHVSTRKVVRHVLSLLLMLKSVADIALVPNLSIRILHLCSSQFPFRLDFYNNNAFCVTSLHIIEISGGHSTSILVFHPLQVILIICRHILMVSNHYLIVPRCCLHLKPTSALPLVQLLLYSLDRRLSSSCCVIRCHGSAIIFGFFKYGIILGLWWTYVHGVSALFLRLLLLFEVLVHDFVDGRVRDLLRVECFLSDWPCRLLCA